MQNPEKRFGLFQTNAALTPLLEPEYRLFVLFRFFYVMGLRMVTTVVAYKLFQLTNDSFAIGLVGLSEFIPVFALALYAGHLIDRSDKRTLLFKTVFSYSLCVIGLIFFSSEYALTHLSTKTIEIGTYSVIFLTGILRAFAGPTTSAIIAQLVPREALKYASNISSSTYLAASITGHATAGFLLLGLACILPFTLSWRMFLQEVFLSTALRKNRSCTTMSISKHGQV